MTVTLSIKLTPKASRNEIQGWISDAEGKPVLKCSVTTVPEKGKANEALIELLAKRLKIAKSSITLIRGDTDRNKVLEIGMETEALYKITGAPPSAS